MGRGVRVVADQIAGEALQVLGVPGGQPHLDGLLPARTGRGQDLDAARRQMQHLHPVVGLVHEPFSLAADALEVADIFEVPLSFLMDPSHHQVRVLRWEGGERRFFAMPWSGAGAGGVSAPHFIWGATAGMLRNFYRFLLA